MTKSKIKKLSSERLEMMIVNARGFIASVPGNFPMTDLRRLLRDLNKEARTRELLIKTEARS